jgi:hypothetical protein
MSRRVQTRRIETLGAGGPQAADTYFDKVVKYIPADIVGAWVALIALFKSVPEKPSNAPLWIIFGITLIITAVWTWRHTTEANKDTAYTQIAISTGAFIVWVFALGDPFTTFRWYLPWYGSVALILYTLLVGAVNPRES